MSGESRIRQVTVTPVAHPEPPLLFCGGLHQPYGLRTVVELDCGDGLVGFGETYGDERIVALLRRVAVELPHVDVLDRRAVRAAVDRVVSGPGLADYGAPGSPSLERTRRSVFAPLEIACLDAQGRLFGRSVSELLGGRVRERVPFAAYLFYKWERHPDGKPDRWGAALDQAGLVGQARAMIEQYGFGSIKLKGGIFPPEVELDALQALRGTFPDRPARLDPNAAWTVPTAIEMSRRLDGVVEYLEDPTASITGMAEVARCNAVPLATNMCVTAFEDLPEAVRQRAVAIVLGDPHYWGGLAASLSLADHCATFGLGMSMHSSAHLGITLAALLQLGAALPRLDYAFDTHWPWQQEDVLPGDSFQFTDGSVDVPRGAGLGVELDRDAVARMHERYLHLGMRRHDHLGYLRTFRPDFRPNVGRW